MIRVDEIIYCIVLHMGDVECNECAMNVIHQKKDKFNLMN
jgi:hypothetical protein